MNQGLLELTRAIVSTSPTLRALTSQGKQEEASNRNGQHEIVFVNAPRSTLGGFADGRAIIVSSHLSQMFLQN